ncbi:MAG: NUDIX hydrolase [Cellulosilyticaceae bacterium]
MKITDRIKTLTPLAQTKFLNMFDVMYQNKCGQERHWMVASRKSYECLEKQYFDNEEDQVDAVVIAAYHQEHEAVVLVRQYRVPLNDYVYELPAGLVEDGLGTNETLAKELKEETGLEFVKQITSASHPKVYLSAGMTDESVAFAYCICKGELSTEGLEADEDLEPVLVTREAVRTLLEGEHKIDIKAYMLLQSFERIGGALFEE